ncbi:CTD nuclear envelope phosphatase 1A-like isoform X2 [Cyprinus carpio]|uniref:protein-serine/threonine phosphatase n=1 Tax=Cyprinus carpio TaxID=7962 RepID=A0A9Q9XZN1_CYPCA|nr:CTD nuclear envelope phosphatase 1A-like isoform X2 [Cyprinus carpio]
MRTADVARVTNCSVYNVRHLRQCHWETGRTAENLCSDKPHIIQYQTVRYDTLPLSPISRNRLHAVKRKILVLDLDETLIHSHHDGVLRPTVRPGTPPDFILKVVIDKHPVRFFVHKRPHVDFFLEVVSQWYELVVFTASMEIYGSAVADKLDNNRDILKRRYYRQHCTLDLGSYIKDLSVVHRDLSSIVILDNSPGAYRSHPDNAIPIKSWFSDPSDTALLNLLPMLDALSQRNPSCWQHASPHLPRSTFLHSNAGRWRVLKAFLQLFLT